MRALSPAENGAEPGTRFLAEIREQDGEWTTGRVKQLYRRHLTGHIYRHNIRRDLAHLHREGHLDRRGDGTSRRYYTLRQEGVTA